MCDKAILGLSSLDSDACWPLRLFRASYKRHFRPEPLCLTLSLFWSPTLPSLVVDLYSLLFPCDATAAELMCGSVLAACRLRFQGRSHFHTHIMKTCIILTKEPKKGCKTRPGKQHKSKRHSWPLHEKFILQVVGRMIFSKGVMALTAQIEISIIARCWQVVKYLSFKNVAFRTQSRPVLIYSSTL